MRNASDGDLEWFLRQGDIQHGMPSWSSHPLAQRWQIITYDRCNNESILAANNGDIALAYYVSLALLASRNFRPASTEHATLT